MQPRLIAISGPLKGASVALVAGEVSVGRDAVNRVAVNEFSVSRRHCLIRVADGDCLLIDLDSVNGTFVNDVPVRERRLEHGDRVRVGNSHFVFLRHDEEQQSTSAVRFGERPATGELSSAVEMRVDEAFKLMARDFHALMKISRTINTVRGLKALQQQLLELMFEVVPVERGAIVMVEDRELASHSAWHARQGATGDETLRLSRTVIRRVVGEGVAVLTNEVREDFPAVESLDPSVTSSLLCVPVVLHGRAIGVIYLAAGGGQFTEDHLHFVTAVANVSAVALEDAQRIEWLEVENQRLRDEADIEHSMIGESARMREIYDFIARVAPTDSTVLVRGESGTGKELIARAIHQNSTRRAKPFVAINCAALTETLFESEMFGHERGAFTGAVAQKKGKFEVGDGGTVFLDEVGEIAPAMQAKLLRALQEREFERVGGTRPIKINVRLIAATNRDLEEETRNGGFRRDLFYRLNVVSIATPALKDRREDVPLLVNYFVAKHAQRCGRTLRGVASEARALLMRYDWPGNVRELENAIERAVVLGTSDIVRPEDLPETLHEAGSESRRQTAPASSGYHDRIVELKKQMIGQALREAGGNYTEAAKLLGVHPNYLHRLVKNLQLRGAAQS